MFGPWMETWVWLKSFSWPTTLIKKHRLNFITIHYLYIIGMSIVSSILVFPAGGLKYIDALFLSSGGATQSGLNPVNINNLNTYQQIVLYLIAMMCTPIFINTFVVFVRLYWFERRFRHVVAEARNYRRTLSRAKTETKEKNFDPAIAEKGVRGRSIVVLHNETGQKIRHNDPNEKLRVNSTDESHSESSSSQEPRVDALPVQQTTFRRDIIFADEVKREDSDEEPHPKIPQSISPEQHIAFLENQRNPKDKGALRIPGPKDYDRGYAPEALDDEGDGGDVNQRVSPEDSRTTTSGNLMKKNITIDLPDHPRLKIDTSHKLPRRQNSNLETPGTGPNISSKRQNSNLDIAGATPAEEHVPASARFLRARTATFSTLKNWASTENEQITPYLSWQPTVGRNSAFVDLTEEQREELGGIEYRSLKTLAVVLVLYYVLFHLLAIVILLPWIVYSKTWGPIVDSDGQSRIWWGFFTPASLFNDLGYTLTPDSFQSFQFAVVPLLIGSFFIIVGNTGFPCMLRFVIWTASRLTRRDSGVWEELRFLLDHPRRCFTLLFPTAATWWLFWILVILNGLDIIFFLILDLHDPTVTSLDPPGFRVLNGLFQAASTRTAGFASVNLANLHPGIQVSYMIMMYISVFPIAISVRRTNVYEEKSLGIYGGAAEESEDEKEPSYVGAHLRRQLGFDLWYIAMGLFIIAIAEGGRLANTNDYAFTLFSVLFEIVSAYGTVGLSLGYPNVDTSFSGQFTVVSKLVVIAMQIRGRHRGLPYELDRAILLPSDSLHWKEDEDAARRVGRRNSSLSNLDAVGHAIPSRSNTMNKSMGRSKYGITTTGSPPPISSPVAATTTGQDHATDTIAPHSLEKTGTSGPSSKAQQGLGQMMAEAANGPRFRRWDGSDA